MKKILILFIILSVFLINNVSAEVTFYKTDLNSNTSCLDTIYSCSTYDEDGVTIRDSGDVVPLYVADYLVGNFGTTIYIRLEKSEEYKFSIKMDPIPFYKDTLEQSMQITDTFQDGVTKFIEGYVGFSIDLLANRSLESQLASAYINSTNTYFDGYYDYDTYDVNQYGSYMHLYRLYFRTKMQIMYVPQTMDDFNYRYLTIPIDFNSGFKMLNVSWGATNYRFVSSSIYTMNDYYNLLNEEASYVNLQNLSQIMHDYNQSVNDFQDEIRDFYDVMLDPTINDDSFGGFFSNFNTIDNGGISGVITAPLRFINNMNNTCNPIKLRFWDKYVDIPCGTTIFWDRPDVQIFRNTWNILVGGSVIYCLLLKLFNVINNMKDPDNSKVEVINL